MKKIIGVENRIAAGGENGIVAGGQNDNPEEGMELVGVNQVNA